MPSARTLIPRQWHTFSQQQKLLESIRFHLIFITSSESTSSSYLIAQIFTLISISQHRVFSPVSGNPRVIFTEGLQIRSIKKLIFEGKVTSIQSDKVLFSTQTLYSHHTSCTNFIWIQAEIKQQMTSIFPFQLKQTRGCQFCHRQFWSIFWEAQLNDSNMKQSICYHWE